MYLQLPELRFCGAQNVFLYLFKMNIFARFDLQYSSKYYKICSEAEKKDGTQKSMTAFAPFSAEKRILKFLFRK